MGAGADTNLDLLTDLLRQVSRSFYLTLRVLPGAIRPQIGLAYLLARATDTIADTDIIPVQDRLAALERLRERILGQADQPVDFSAFITTDNAPVPNHPAEQILLQRIEEAIALLKHCEPEDRKLIRRVLDTITSGQLLDLRRFGLASASQVMALANRSELEDYTYRVAGCVGEFWTQICRRHLFPKSQVHWEQLLKDGIRFGQGLQLVNILRDMPADLQKGRCYLPLDGLKALTLEPASLLSPTTEVRMRPLYNQWLQQAEDYLEAGWRYTNNLPPGNMRVRLACAWPILIGVKTLAKLKTSPILASNIRIKVDRADVRNIIIRSVLCYPRPGAWRQLFEKCRGRC